MNTIHVIFQIITLLMLAMSCFAGYKLDGQPKTNPYYSFKEILIHCGIWLFLLTMGGFFTFGGM